MLLHILFMASSSQKTVTNEEEEELRKLFQDTQATFDEDPAKWLVPFRDKLFSMFRSPMKEEYSHEAFRWVAQLSLSIGDFSWMTTGDKWTQSEAKIFSFIARLSLAEIQILLPLIQRHVTCGDEPDIEEGKLLARSANQDDYDKFGTHLVILECIIKTLVSDQAEDDEDNKQGLNPVTDAIHSDELKNLLERLKETMSLICDHLELVHRHWQELVENTDSEKFSSVQGTIRIISVWLSEDPGSFKLQCKRFLIDLMIKNFMLDITSNRNDFTILALHSLCADSDELLESFRATPKLKEVLEKYLKYVEKEQRKSDDHRSQKIFKLRCGLVRDLARLSLYS